MSPWGYARLLVTAFLVGLITPANAQVTDVWAVGDGENIFRYTTDHFDRLENSIWDGETIQLRGLRNEVHAFQVIVVADSNGASTVEIDVKPPVHEETGTVIAVNGTNRSTDTVPAV